MSFPSRPYVGLRPYRHNENLIFFGRDAQIVELLERLHKNRFLAVVGTSGCGKSSLIRAGLIPALKGGYLVEDSSKWLTAKMKPGEAPMSHLARSILELDGKTDKEAIEKLVTQIKKNGISALLDPIQTSLKKHKSNLFLLIDQFEELFRFSSEQKGNKSKNESIDFVNTILKLARQNKLPIYVVITMRSDFIGDCAQYHGLPEALNQSQYLVPRLTRSQLKQVIEGPANLFGIKFQSILTSSLVNYLGQSQDDLPVLQHALLRMYQNEVSSKEQDGEIDFKDHDAIGGLEEALSQDANKAFNSDSLSDQDREITEKLFKALTTKDTTGRKIRNPIGLNKLIVICGASEQDVVKIINKFNSNDRSFLIYNPDEGSEQIIDISHESLIRQWDTLKEWVDDESKAAQFYKRLSEEQRLNEERLATNPEAGPRLLDDIDTKKAINWMKRFNPSEAWALEYDAVFNSDYNKTVLFYNDSKAEYDAKLEKQRIVQRNKTRLKKFLSAAAIAAIVVLIGISIIDPQETYISYQEIDWEEEKDDEDDAWEMVLHNNTENDYEQFLIYFKDGIFEDMAREKLKIRRYDSEWNIALGLNSLESYNDYLSSAIDSIYSESPEGESLFKANCAACHDLEKPRVGPRLKNIENRLKTDEGLGRDWLYSWIHNSQKLIDSGDPYANKIYNDYNKTPCVAFPSFTEADIDKILGYTNVITEYSRFAHNVQRAKDKIDAIKTSASNSEDRAKDESAWKTAQNSKSVTAYLKYYVNDDILGLHQDEALSLINQVGNTGFLYSGRQSGNTISDRVFDIVGRNEVEYFENDMLKVGDVVTLKGKRARNIYRNKNMSVAMTKGIQVYDLFYITEIILDGTAVTAKIIY